MNTGDVSFYIRLNEQPSMLKTSSFSRMIKMRQSATAQGETRYRKVNTPYELGAKARRNSIKQPNTSHD